jgi:multidrug resistance efflux pump
MNKFAWLMLLPAIFTACNNNAAQEKRDTDKSTYAIGISQVVGIGKVSPENDIIQLSSPVNGIVEKIYKNENDTVQVGSLILALEHRLEDVNLMQLTRKIQTQTAQIKVDQAAVLEQETKVINATEQLRHLQNLLLKGAEMQQTVDDASTNLASLNANLNRLEANVNVSISRLKESKTALKTAQVEREQKFIRSPIKGKVLALSVLLGGSVNMQQSFAQISPGGNTIAICEIDELYANQIYVGQRGWIRHVGSSDTLSTGDVYFVSDYLQKKSLFSDQSGEKEDRRVRTIKMKLDYADQLLLNARVECVIVLSSKLEN